MRDETQEISHARLAEIAAVFSDARVAAELFDPDWNLVWVSDDLKTLIGEEDEDKIGVGDHVLLTRSNELWSHAATDESQEEWSRANLGYILHETPEAELAKVLESMAVSGSIDPQLPDGTELGPAPPSWSFGLTYRRPGFPPQRTTCDARRVIGADGSRIGTAFVYAPALSATVMDLLARGDELMYERMARLVVPGRRAAAILFADLQASGALSRRLPSAIFFRLISSLTTAFDDAVGSFGGIVGKHAGDGVTAFFLADDAGSMSKAARGALEAAEAIIEAAARTATEFAEEGVQISPEDVRMNVGVHWGGALYMGQIVTGGRLEVTALGDEVNEGARIQQAARDGVAYASKAVVERLDAEDARAVGIDPDAALYSAVADLPGVDEKTVRDAGGIAVTEIAGPCP